MPGHCGSWQTAGSGSAGMRRIDLTCLIVSPIGVGTLMTYCGTAAATAAICGWNLLAWVPECLLLQYSIKLAPWLWWAFLHSWLHAVCVTLPICSLTACNGRKPVFNESADTSIAMPLSL